MKAWLGDTLGKILACTLVGMLFSSAASAERLTAEEVLRRARIDRTEFDTVMFDARVMVTSLENFQQAAPFLLILDELRIIQLEWGFSVFDAAMVAEYGDKLTQVVEPWVDLRNIGNAELAAFSLWSTEQTRGVFLARQQRISRDAATIDELLEIASNFNVVLEQFKKPGPINQMPSSMIGELLAAQGSTHKTFIDRFRYTASIENYKKLLKLLSGPVGIQEGGFVLQRQIVGSIDAALFPIAVDYSVLMAQRLAEFTEPVPDDILNLPGSIITDSIYKALQLGQVMPSASVKAGIAVVPPPMVEELSGKVTAMRLDLIRSEQLRFLADVAQALADRLQDFGLAAEVANMLAQRDSALLADGLNAKDLEGVYEIVIGDRPAKLIIARASVASLLAGVEMGHVPFSFNHAHFADDGRTIEIDSSLASQSSGSGSRFLRLLFDDSGDLVEGQYFNGTGFQDLRGQRLGRFDDFIRMATPALSSPEGVYRGEIDGVEVLLTIRRSGAQVAGSMMIKPQTHRLLVPFEQVHFNPRNGAIYLTSRYLADGPFSQIRATVSAGEIVGQYVAVNRSAAAPIRLVKLLN